jgi:3-deoxy-7-phosphoheptulonate synthase
MQNFELLKELGKMRKPVLLKRGLSSTFEELLMSAEYLMAGGNEQVILCERRHPHIRDIHPQHAGRFRRTVLKSLSTCVIVDRARTAVGIGALHGVRVDCGGSRRLIIEVHNDPRTPCPRQQSLRPSGLPRSASA